MTDPAGNKTMSLKEMHEQLTPFAKFASRAIPPLFFFSLSRQSTAIFYSYLGTRSSARRCMLIAHTVVKV